VVLDQADPQAADALADRLDARPVRARIDEQEGALALGKGAGGAPQVRPVVVGLVGGARQQHQVEDVDHPLDGHVRGVVGRGRHRTAVGPGEPGLAVRGGGAGVAQPQAAGVRGAEQLAAGADVVAAAARAGEPAARVGVDIAVGGDEDEAVALERGRPLLAGRLGGDDGLAEQAQVRAQVEE
jgi:hypothetical protein